MASFYDEHFYIKRYRFRLGEPLDRTQVPEPARRVFEAILELDRLGTADLLNDETIDIDELRSLDARGIAEEMASARVQFKRVLDEPGAWMMGIRDCTAPFNPAGHEFYCRDDGTYLGFIEL